MSNSLPASGLQLHSLVKSDGTIELSLVDVPVVAPGPKEVVIRVGGSPLNSSDLGLLLGAEGSGGIAADTSKLVISGSADRPVMTAPISAAALKGMAHRVGTPAVAGNEGAGVVIAAGESELAQSLLGKTVAVLGGSMYSEYRTISARACLVLPSDVTPQEGASCFVNPLTALGLVETMRREGHSAIVQTAAASNLGQMVVRICQKDGIELVNIVRNPAQVELLRAMGATHVYDSSAPGFEDDLADAVTQTGATIAFDAVGGGKLTSQILAAMEVALVRKDPTGSIYGSPVHKQVYIYGGLDTSATIFNRDIGLAWGISGWLLSPFLVKVGPEEVQKLRERVAAEIKTTFASHYARAISLREALNPEFVASYVTRATGEKYLIDPSLK